MIPAPAATAVMSEVSNHSSPHHQSSYIEPFEQHEHHHQRHHQHHQVGRVRGQLQELLSYDWLSVPLVYTQTVAHHFHDHDHHDDNGNDNYDDNDSNCNIDHDHNDNCVLQSYIIL